MAKYCPKCYAGVGAEDSVCSNCGNVLTPKIAPINETPVPEISDAIDLSSDTEVAQEISISESTTAISSIQENSPITPPVETKEATMTLGDWMITLLLLYLPIVNIVMLIIWSVDAKTNPTKKHFAWASLIYMGIGIVLSIIISSIMFAIIMSMMESMYYFY
jgi:hypothetical protein